MRAAWGGVMVIVFVQAPPSNVQPSIETMESQNKHVYLGPCSFRTLCQQVQKPAGHYNAIVTLGLQDWDRTLHRQAEPVHCELWLACIEAGPRQPLPEAPRSFSELRVHSGLPLSKMRRRRAEETDADCQDRPEEQIHKSQVRLGDKEGHNAQG